MSISAIVALAAAGAAVLAVAGALLAMRRTRAHATALDDAIERGRSRFDEIVAAELESRASELERTLALARSEALAALADDERRIAEERRRDVIERERDAMATLGEALTSAQRSVEHRLAGWTTDLEKMQNHLAEELQRIAQRQDQLTAALAKRLEDESDRLRSAIDEHRALVARTREELQRATTEVARETSGELEQHGAERRRALHEIEERLRRRESELQAQIDHEQTEAVQRIAASLGEVETRQVEQVRRVVSREATRYAEAAAVQFEQTIKTAREEAAKRLRRELDLSVERFAREADGVLAERVEQVAHGAVRQVEARLTSLPQALERHRDETLVSFDRRVQDLEVSLRARLQEIAAEAEAERDLLDRRLHDLLRRIDELAARA